MTETPSYEVTKHYDDGSDQMYGTIQCTIPATAEQGDVEDLMNQIANGTVVPTGVPTPGEGESINVATGPLILSVWLLNNMWIFTFIWWRLR